MEEINNRDFIPFKLKIYFVIFLNNKKINESRIVLLNKLSFIYLEKVLKFVYYSIITEDWRIYWSISF